MHTNINLIVNLIAFALVFALAFLLVFALVFLLVFALVFAHVFTLVFVFYLYLYLYLYIILLLPSLPHLQMQTLFIYTNAMINSGSSSVIIMFEFNKVSNVTSLVHINTNFWFNTSYR